MDTSKIRDIPFIGKWRNVFIVRYHSNHLYVYIVVIKNYLILFNKLTVYECPVKIRDTPFIDIMTSLFYFTLPWQQFISLFYLIKSNLLGYTRTVKIRNISFFEKDVMFLVYVSMTTIYFLD